jgi:quaternary ammonium compound-resistance protein SugE
VLLFLAQRTIPMGTAYAVWTGIGAVGAFAVGIFFFGDAATAFRVGSAALILAGVVGLKLG